jgi:hypothetical protein
MYKATTAILNMQLIKSNGTAIDLLFKNFDIYFYIGTVAYYLVNSASSYNSLFLLNTL